MSEPSPKPFKLNTQVVVSEPPLNFSGNKSTLDPAVIIHFLWFNSRLAHVRKYTESLRNTFPTSTIVSVMVTGTFFASTEKSKEELLSPVVDILHREQDNGNISRGVLLLIMSNVTVKGSIPCHPSQNPIALVFDSSPSDNGLEAIILGSAPNNPLLRLLVIPVITLAYGALCLVNFFAGNRPLFEELRSTYLEADILPSISKSTDGKTAPRLYVYSKKDKVTLAKYVESHIQEATLLGLDVTIEMFKDSAHVAHALQDPDRYWGAVRKVWSKASHQVLSQL